MIGAQMLFNGARVEEDGSGVRLHWEPKEWERGNV